MLSIHWIQDVDYYLDQATADYYFRPGEPPGRWWGRGARSLGLTGTVTAQQLKALCKGFSPDGRVLIQNAGAKDHQQAWDLTFSAPKSVSVLWTQAPRAVRLKIRKFHHKAVKAALDYLADTALLTRRGKGGKVREHALPVVAVFEHGSNRELEPQLHSHCILVNAAGRADGTFGTILSDPFYRHKLTAGAIYRAQLAYLLRNGLGLEIDREEKAFAVRGVPKKLVDHYSTRRRQIETKLGSKGSHSSKATATAALDTRKTKRKSPPPRGELFRRWQATNSNFGFSEAMAQRLLGRVAPDNRLPVLDDHITRVIAELLETESYFSEQQLIRGVAIEVVADGVPATDVIDQVRGYLAVDPEILTLGPHHDETMFTTRAMWALEKELFAAIAQGEADSAHVVGTRVVGRILDRELPLGPTLMDDESKRNTEQRNAVIGLVTTPGDVHVMEGMAGTGKTFALKVARQAWEKAGYRVTGMALSAVAAANLQEGSGIPSDTIAMRLLQLDGRRDFARHHKRQLKRLLTGKRTYAYDGTRFRLDRKTIVVVDEAGMVGTRQMVKLLKHVRKAGAKLVLVGDRRQLQPVEAGGAFAPIARATKRADLQHIVRQAVEPDDPDPSWHREAGKLIAAGAVSKAIKLFAERGRLSVLPERDQTMLSIVRDWSVQGIADPSDHIVLAATRAEVSELNTMCQSSRLQAGALGTEHCIIGEVKLHTGDIVLFTKNSRLYQVKNGDRGEVLGFNRLNKTMAVRLHQSKKTVFLPYRNYKEVQLGYAMTTHKAQGATVPSVYVLLGGPMQDRHLSYVQATRACESTRLYVDKSHAGPDIKHLLKHMERPRPKKLAHDIVSTSGPGGGLPPDTSAPASNATSSNSQKSRRAKKRRKSSATSACSAGAGKAAATPTVHQEPAGVRNQQLTKGRDAQVPTDGARNTPSISSPAAKPSVQVIDRADSVAPRSPKTVARPPVAADQSKANGSHGGQLRAAPVHGSDTRHDSPQPAPPESGEPKTVTAKPPSEVTPTRTPVRSQIPVGADHLIPALRPRDIFDLTHVNVVTTTDADFLRAAVKRYGAVPGGVVVEGSAQCLVQIRSLGIDPRQPSSLLINGFKTFDTGLSAEEVAFIWHVVLETGQATTDFGALSQRKTIGIDTDTEVGVTMLKADNALGAVAYGYDSQYNLGRRPGPDHRNPFVEETEQSLLKVGRERLFFNYMNEILPQLFLTVSDTRFAETKPDLVSVTSTKVTAALAITTWGASVPHPLVVWLTR